MSLNLSFFWLASGMMVEEKEKTRLTIKIKIKDKAIYSHNSHKLSLITKLTKLKIKNKVLRKCIHLPCSSTT